MNVPALLILLLAIAWLVVLVRAVATSNWWVAALYAGVAAGLADLLFVLYAWSDQPEYRWLVPCSGILFVCALLALASKNVRGVRIVGVAALLLGAAWGFVAMRDLFGSGRVDALELVFWAGLVAVHLMTFDASRRYTSSRPPTPYGQAFD